jgi:hypothetical protein
MSEAVEMYLAIGLIWMVLIATVSMGIAAGRRRRR